VLCRMRRCSVAKISKVQWRDNVSSHSHPNPFVQFMLMSCSCRGMAGGESAMPQCKQLHPSTLQPHGKRTPSLIVLTSPTALTSGFMPKFQCNGCILYPSLTASTCNSTSSGTLSPNPHFPACFHAETRIMHHSNYHPCSKTRGKVSDTHHS